MCYQSAELLHMPVSELILLVDDIPDHIAPYRAALEEAGYRVEIARRGCDALAAARAVPPDCVVIDVRLPDMSGWELCRRLKAEHDTRKLPVIVLTPDASLSYASDSAAVQCNAWLAQPTLADDLVRAVRHVLARDEDAPHSREAALLGAIACPACDSDQVRATIRVSPIQYYSCRECGHVWRVEML